MRPALPRGLHTARHCPPQRPMSSPSLPTPAELRQLLPFVSGARPWRLVRYAALDWMMIVTCWAAMCSMPNPVVYAAGVVLIAGRLQSFGVILHDACHLPARRMSLPL